LKIEAIKSVGKDKKGKKNGDNVKEDNTHGLRIQKK